MAQYQNRDGVQVEAVRIDEAEDEATIGFWLLTDANGVESRIPDEAFQRNFSPVAPAVPSK